MLKKDLQLAEAAVHGRQILRSNETTESYETIVIDWMAHQIADARRFELAQKKLGCSVFNESKAANIMPRRGIEEIQLCVVAIADLSRMCEMQIDPESNRMAVTIPQTVEVFASHWQIALRSSEVTAKVILATGVIVGYISCFRSQGLNSVGYWIDRKYWGLGFGSKALELLLFEVKFRPLHARAATSNKASMRLLPKCGFGIVRFHVSPADDRYPECEEAVFVLR